MRVVKPKYLRSVTDSSLEFVRGLVDNNNNNNNDSKKTLSIKQKAQLLRNACKAHTKRTRECSTGQGVDRHMFGLWNLARAKQRRLPGYLMPKIFTDPIYSSLMTSFLSTSNCGSKAVSMFGFAPVTATGLGVGYVIHDDGMQIAVSSFQNEAKIYVKLLEESLVEMYEILAVAEMSPKL